MRFKADGAALIGLTPNAFSKYPNYRRVDKQRAIDQGRHQNLEFL